MNLVASPVKEARLLIMFLIAAALFLAYGCGDDAKVVVVDFSKTIPVEGSGNQAPDYRPLRLGVAAMVSPKETFNSHRQALDYIGRHLGKDIEFIQRKTYGEINELFTKGEIDLAFICSGPYATGKERYGFELLATPQVHGSHFYQAYLIVEKGSPYHRLEDLRGRIFAFTDPDSNTGKMVPTYWLAQMGERPETFFGKTIYTYSHDNSILAVARGLVDGAGVDALVWEYYHYKNPNVTHRTRVIKKSESYGIPPLVASRDLPPELKDRTRKLLLSMHKDSEGREILDELMIDRFIAPREEWYEPIRRMERKLALLDQQTHALPKPQK